MKSKDEKFFENIKRCKKCILPETFPGISFNEKGICNYCNNHNPIKVLGEEELLKKLSFYKNKGQEYDCLVPFSGGRDSTYVLHQMVKKYKIRVISLTVDSGAILPEGYDNIKNAVNKLKIPHVWLKDDKQIKNSSENMRKKFHGWLRYPSINTIVPVLNSGDKTMNLRMFNYAHDHNIPLMMGGNNIGNSIFEQEHWKTGFMGIYPNDRGYYSKSDRMKLSGKFLMEFLQNPKNYSYPVFREYFTGAGVYFFEEMLKPNDVDTLGFYDYIYWDEKEIISTIKKECDWKSAKDTTATWRVDDAAYPLLNYMYLKLVGFTEHDEWYSKMIREEQLTRDVALKRCRSDQKPRIGYINKTCEELGTKKEKLDEVLDNYHNQLLTEFNLKSN